MAWSVSPCCWLVATCERLACWVRGCQCCLSSSWTRERAGSARSGSQVQWVSKPGPKSLPTRCGSRLPDRSSLIGEAPKWAITARWSFDWLSDLLNCAWFGRLWIKYVPPYFAAGVRLVRTTPPCLPREYLMPSTEIQSCDDMRFRCNATLAKSHAGNGKLD